MSIQTTSFRPSPLGYDTAEVEVLTRNERALSLYRHLGYEIAWQGTREDEVLHVTLHKTLLTKGV